MNVLVSGTSGFVGKHIKARLLSLGHVVYDFKRGDTLVSDLATEDFGSLDCIIHCAGEINEPHKMFESNVMLTERLLKFARDAKIPKFIHIGSSSEYGLINVPRREDMHGAPVTIYDATKQAATALCLGFAAQYDMDVCIARPFSLFGPFDQPRKLVSRLYRAYISHEVIPLYAGDHDWLYIDDFCDGIITLMNAPRELTKGDIVNFGSGISSSNNEVVRAMEKALGGSLNIVHKTGRYHSYDTENWVADISKARIKYGWSPKHTLETGMKEFVLREWFAEDKG